jgi:AcrR family transcriptional regulator
LGVSHAAAYRHFKNKQALLEAIAIRGFEMLNRDFANAVIGKEVSTEKLGQFYIQFGLKNPGYYRVMFGVNFAENMNADLKKVCFDSFDSLLNSIGKDTATNVKKAFFAWSLVHGFVLLLLDGQLTALAQEYSVDLATIEPVFMKMTSAALNG